MTNLAFCIQKKINKAVEEETKDEIEHEGHEAEEWAFVTRDLRQIMSHPFDTCGARTSTREKSIQVGREECRWWTILHALIRHAHFRIVRDSENPGHHKLRGDSCTINK